MSQEEIKEGRWILGNKQNKTTVEHEIAKAVLRGRFIAVLAFFFLIRK